MWSKPFFFFFFFFCGFGFILTNHLLRSSRTPPTWPTAFNVSFFATVVDFNIFGTPSTLYYDWSLKSQVRIGMGGAGGIPVTLVTTLIKH